MQAHRPRRRSTIRRKSIRHARCATRRSTARTRTAFSSSRRVGMRKFTKLRPIVLRGSYAPAFFFIVFLYGLPARAQDGAQTGIDQGNYNIKQSIEFGGRFTSIGGDQQTYDTFVNLQQGARLLGFTIEMQSLNHHDSLFDRLYFSNFGYGGDPNSVSRLRVAKN